MLYVLKGQKGLTSMSECKNMLSIRVFALKVHLVCTWNAWPKHEQGTHGAKCANHTTNDQNMINMNNYGDTQKLVLIKVQKSEKIPKAFYQTLRVHTLHMYVKQCMNIWKSCLNTYHFCHKGANIQSQSSFKTNPN